MPEALAAFLDSENFEDALRLTVSLGGDADTVACIPGGVAEAPYGEINPQRLTFGHNLLTDNLRAIPDAFHENHILPRAWRSPENWQDLTARWHRYRALSRALTTTV